MTQERVEFYNSDLREWGWFDSSGHWHRVEGNPAHAAEINDED